MEIYREHYKNPYTIPQKSVSYIVKDTIFQIISVIILLGAMDLIKASIRTVQKSKWIKLENKLLCFKCGKKKRPFFHYPKERERKKQQQKSKINITVFACLHRNARTENERRIKFLFQRILACILF